MLSKYADDVTHPTEAADPISLNSGSQRLQLNIGIEGPARVAAAVERARMKA
jgi:hypothetical protein